jgi:hypothetical protein
MPSRNRSGQVAIKRLISGGGRHSPYRPGGGTSIAPAAAAQRDLQARQADVVIKHYKLIAPLGF